MISRRSLIALAASAVRGEEPVNPLIQIRRIFVDRLNGESSAQIRDMIINALQSSKIFVLTENQEKADALLRGSAEDLIYTDQFQSSESLNARASVGSSSTGSAGRRLPGVSVGVGQNESTKIAERKHEAMAAVRLVSREGDVIWSTTQESGGAKFRGASADVAEKVVKQLLADIDKARRPQLPIADPGPKP